MAFAFERFHVEPDAANRMRENPLRLAVTGTWRGEDEYERHRNAWAVLRESVLERDGRTCRYCGWAKPPFHVHHVDGDPRNDALPNLMTVCPLCHACRHIGRTVSAGLGGVVETEGPRNPCLQNELDFVLRAAWDAGVFPTPSGLGRAMRSAVGVTELRAVGAEEVWREADEAARYGGTALLPAEWLFVPAGTFWEEFFEKGGSASCRRERR